MYLCAHARAERYVSEKEVGRNDVGSFIRVYVYASKRQDSEFTDADVTGDGGCIYNRVGVSGTMINSGIPVLPFFSLSFSFIFLLCAYMSRDYEIRAGLCICARGIPVLEKDSAACGVTQLHGAYIKVKSKDTYTFWSSFFRNTSVYVHTCTGIITITTVNDHCRIIIRARAIK